MKLNPQTPRALARLSTLLLITLSVHGAHAQQNLTEQQKQVVEQANQMAVAAGQVKVVQLNHSTLYKQLSASKGTMVVVTKNIQAGLVKALSTARLNGAKVMVFTDSAVVKKNPAYTNLKRFGVEIYHGKLSSKAGFLVSGNLLVAGNLIDPALQANQAVQGGFGPSTIMQNVPLMQKTFKRY